MTLEEEIRHVLNCHNAEAGSNTPDFILAQYLVNCLQNFNAVVATREAWYGRPLMQLSVPKPVTP